MLIHTSPLNWMDVIHLCTGGCEASAIYWQWWAKKKKIRVMRQCITIKLYKIHNSTDVTG